MEKNKNQKHPNTDQNKDRKSGKQQEISKQGRPERKTDPVANQGSGSERSQTDRSREQSQTTQQSAELKRPLTNQDEQRKPTNVGSSSDTGLNEEEQEGDPSQERIKPYKNIGDDSKEVEKKTPAME